MRHTISVVEGVGTAVAFMAFGGPKDSLGRAEGIRTIYNLIYEAMQIFAESPVRNLGPSHKPNSELNNKKRKYNYGKDYWY